MSSRTLDATQRALRRVQAGETPTSAARAEGIDPSTLWRARIRRKNAQGGALGRFVIVGAGALGRELRQWIVMAGRDDPIVFLDDHATMAGVIGNVDSYERREGDEVLIAIAEPKEREAVTDRFSAVGTFIASQVMTGNCTIGAGSLLLPHVLISAEVKVGAGCLLNTHASVGHDCVLGDFCTLSSNVSLTGRVSLGKRVFAGTGATVLPGVSVGDDAYIGAGAVVLKNVPAGAKVFGNPARSIA
jgi:sugar O-acyltransferase (sialic acid O-acetyltransferase NeuD family)